MSKRPSITSTRSFQSRLVEAQQWRIALVAACLVVVLTTWLLRRATHGVVASGDARFYSIITVIGAALVLLALSFADVRRRAKQGGPLPSWHLIAGVAVDLGVPFTILTLLHFASPRGAYTALSGPSLLIVPIVIMLSVLRLRPLYSLLIGLCAAAAHAALAAHTLAGGGVDPGAAALLFTYGALLALTGVAAAILSMLIRKYIHEAADEAQAAERAARKLSEIEHELDIARDIQQGLLPSAPPVLPGFDIAGQAHPATHTGGDYYDWQPLRDGRLVVAIADVTGHGIGPALVMAVCRAYARAMAPGAQDAADLLERLNELIVHDVAGRRFITMAIAIVSPDGSVELLSAGHGPTLCFRAADKRVEQFGGNGLPLGISAGERYDPTSHLQLAHGDVLVLITDGFMECAGPGGKLFGVDRLSAAIAKNAARPAADLIAAVEAEATAFAQGAPQQDDMTIVVIRRV